MAAVTLAEVKTRLKIEADDASRDDELNTLIDTAGAMLYNLTGISYDGTNALAKTACFFIIQDLYDKRGMSSSGGYKADILSDKTRQVVDMILSQLSFCYPQTPEPDEDLTWNDLLGLST